jgi:uncharacterized protein
MNRVTQFQVLAHDPKRAATFYEQALGWKIQTYQGEMEYWFISTGDDKVPGINGGIMRHRDNIPNVMNTIGVASVDETLEKIVAHGGQVARPKFAVPGMGYLAHIVDTEGNLFGVMEYNSSVE